MITTVFPASRAMQQMSFMSVAGMQIVSILDLPGALLADPVPAGLEAYPMPEAGPLRVPIPVPLLPGMDSVEVETATLSLASGLVEHGATGTRTSAGEIDVRMPSDDPTATLKRLEITGFRLTQTGAGLPSTTSGEFLVKAPESNDLVPGVPGATVPYLHLLVQPLQGGRAAPPAASAPRFDMPGDGGDRYGPALSGATLSLGAVSDGATTLSLTLAPPLGGKEFRVGFVHATDGKGAAKHGGLPNETAGWAHWSMAQANATFTTWLRDVGVSLTGPGAPALATVAVFPGAMPGTRTDIDLTPALRAIARAALPAAAGDDLGLALELSAAAGGSMLLSIPRPRLRYIKKPLAAPEPLLLRGSRSELRLTVPSGLIPNGISLAIAGRYGVPRLLDVITLPSQRVRVGYRLVPGRRLAMPLALSSAEQLLPLRRLAVHGRAEGSAALLLGLAQGSGAVPGAPHGDPVAIQLTASAGMDWHRGEWRMPALAAPHPAQLFLTIEVTHGAFLLATDPSSTAPALIAEPGSGWSPALAPPLTAVWVDEADPATGAPAPLHALDLDGPGGVLNRNIAGVSSGAAPPAFLLNWLAVSPAHTAMLDAIAQAAGALTFGFFSRRDVDLTLSDAVLTYDPWAARG